MKCATLREGKPGLYSNTMVAANSDYLELDLLFTQPDNSTIEFEVEVLDDTVTELLTSDGTLSNYIALNSGSLFVLTGGSSNNVLLGDVTNGVHTITIRRGVSQNFASIDGGPEELCTATAAISILQLYKAVATTYNGVLRNFTLDGTHFPFNEVRGAAFYSEDKTLSGTRNTTF
jgi:hypothetical protein